MREFIRPAAVALSIAVPCGLGRRCVRRQRAGAGQAANGPRPGSAATRPAADAEADRADRQADPGRADGAEGHGCDHRQAAGKRPPDAKVTAQLDAVAKKNGFASYDEYNDVVDNISLVLGGFDPATKKYVGSEAVSRRRSPRSRPTRRCRQGQEGSARRPQRGAEGAGAAIENKGNIDLVGKYYDKLADALGGDEQ